ncbi:nascent polypeptide-associated complex subunit alpha, muscle-specific form-like isoform X1 [Penaeus japonicus]|uniref:nascent polypeptide-associated complex subunit alpha, muscle-specific form-like isoform X1 n=2 Tax=Penaeus japonicus TaxID=27405 RepID=UPI001C70D155|nr:nascent polypeptide-associated complex subunit alpha, muscle-specific form-like isoform X1 [Penaeus japonicus]
MLSEWKAETPTEPAMTSAADGTGGGAGRDTRAESSMKIVELKRNKKKCRKKAGKLRPLVEVSKRGFSPAKGAVKPTRADAKPAQGGANPVQGGASPAQGGASPVQGGASPAQRGANPVQGGASPAQRRANPSQGGTNPAMGRINFAQGGANPTLREANPTLNEANPTQGGTNPAIGRINPAQGGANASRGEGIPARVESFLGQERVNPGGMNKSNKKKAKKKVGKLRPLVEVPKRGVGPAKGGTIPANPIQGGTNPAIGRINPAQGGANPSQGGANPAQRGDNPTLREANPTQGGTNPAIGRINPAQGGANPVQRGDNPTLREANPAIGRINPAQGGANASRGEGIPAKVESFLGQERVSPGGMNKSNKKKAKKKVGKVRPLVEVPKRGVGSAKGGTVPTQEGAKPAPEEAIPTQGGTKPAQGGDFHTNTGVSPAKVEAKPADGEAIFTKGAAKPIHGVAIPTEVETKPVPRGAIPTEVGTKPVPRGAIPTQGGTKPVPRGAVPTQGGTKPVPRGAVPTDVGTKLDKTANVGEKKGNKHSVAKVREKSPLLKRKMVKIPKDRMNLEGNLLEEYLSRVEMRNRRTLYVKVPSSVVVNNIEDLKPLFESAVSTRFPQRRVYGYCYIEYDSQEMAEKMKPVLAEKKILGESYQVDFVGEKSKNYIPPKVLSVYSTELYVDGLPPGTTYEDLRSTFSTAQIIQTRKYLKKGNAYIKYKRKEEAEKVFREQGGLRVKGQEVMVLYVKAYPDGQSADPEAKRRKVDDTAKNKQDLED